MNTDHIPPVIEPMISPSNFAQLLGISRRSFQYLRAAGKLPAPDIHFRKIIRWQRQTIITWLAEKAKKGV